MYRDNVGIAHRDWRLDAPGDRPHEARQNRLSGIRRHRERRRDEPPRGRACVLSRLQSHLVDGHPSANEEIRCSSGVALYDAPRLPIGCDTYTGRSAWSRPGHWRVRL